MGLYTLISKRWDFQAIAIKDDDGRERTYHELDNDVRRVVWWLKQQGLEAQDVVCVQAPKSQFLLDIVLGCLACGVTVLPLNQAYQKEQCLFYIKDSRAKMFITEMTVTDDWPCPAMPLGRVASEIMKCEPVEILPKVELQQVAMLLYTSGTTGKPKGAMITHDNVFATVEGLNSLWNWSSNDRLLHVLPIFHVHGLVVAQFGALYAGAKSVWMHRFQAEKVGHLIEKEQITVFMGVPTIYYRLLPCLHKKQLNSMRLFTSGSAPLPVSIHHTFQKTLGFRILERYGMTEVGIVLSNPCDGLRKIGTVGLPVGKTKIRIVEPSTERDLGVNEVGEIWISGPSVISCYLRRPEATAHSITNGWLKSGDLGKRDKDGYVSIVGRAKDLIITGGLNVYPIDVETHFRECDSIEDIAVVGIPDDEWGEQVIAVVVASSLNIEALQASLSRLATYQRPKRWCLVDEFPRNAMGKVQKSQLRLILKQNPHWLFKLSDSVS